MRRDLPMVRLLKVALASLVIAATMVGFVAADDLETPVEWLKAAALKPGDTIALVAPAAPIKLPALTEYARSLEDAGYQVLISPGIDRKSGYLAGTDTERADELNVAIRDPKVKAIFACQGGFSDLTALHLAISRKAHLISFHSPMPLASLWKKDAEHAFALESFQRAVFADQYKTRSIGYTINLPPGQPKPKTLVGGKVRGRLTGGNFTLISSTLGTPFAIDPKGKILVIEDVHEAPYRIDRFLSQVRLAGVLDDIVGVVAGDFSGDDPKDVIEFDRILDEYFSPLKKPAVIHFPVGHILNNATLPMGAMAELDADAGSLRLLENPVELDQSSTTK
jgi:muramoyltetrapeptide carboxypeptidase